MAEKQFQQSVLDLATKLGYEHYHTHDSRRSDPGFPDLVLAHREKGRILFIECKLDDTKTTPAQDYWHDTLAWCDQEVYVVRPRDWDEIAYILMLPQKPTKFLRAGLSTAVVKL